MEEEEKKEPKRPEWIRSGKRSFMTMQEESDQIMQNEFLISGSEVTPDGFRAIDLPLLNDVPEEVWRTLFPPPAQLSCESLPKLLHTLLYLRLQLDIWRRQLANLKKQPVFTVKEVVALLHCYQLLIDAKVSDISTKDLVDICQNLPSRLPPKTSPPQFYAEVIGGIHPESEWLFLSMFHVPFTNAIMKAQPNLKMVRTRCYCPDIPNSILLDFFRFTPSKRDMEWPFPKTWHPVRALAPKDESGPCSAEEFQIRLKKVTYGLCDHPAIRALLDEGLIALSGGVLTHCLTNRASKPNPSFRGHDIDLFVAVPPHSNAKQSLIRVLDALEMFRADVFPLKRTYVTHRCTGVVDVLLDDLEVTFQILLCENRTLASIIHDFDFTLNQLLYNGQKLLATVFGVLSWGTTHGFIEGYTTLARIYKAQHSGIELFSNRTDLDYQKSFGICKHMLGDSDPIFCPPLSTSPVEYNRALISQTFAKGKAVFTNGTDMLASDPNLPGSLDEAQYGSQSAPEPFRENQHCHDCAQSMLVFK